MKKLIILLCLTLFMVSCATNSASNNRAKNIEVSKNAKIALADKSSDEKVICRQTRRTGSNRITTVCRSSSELKATRNATQNELQRQRFKSGPSGESKGL